MIDTDTLDLEQLRRSADIGGDAHRAIRLAAQLGGEVPLPGSGDTRRRWDILAEVSAVDLTAGRVLEAHLDALAIQAEAGLAPDDPAFSGIAADRQSTWGVFAAEGPGVRVTATETAAGWRLDGTKPWCSLADQLSHALITAHVPAGRQLFAIALDDTVRTDPSPWVSRGLAEVPSTPIELDGTRAVPVGAEGWYLQRPGFAWGGMGVAACWYGGAVGLARSVATQAMRKHPDQIGLMHLGGIDVALFRAGTALAAAAADVDAGRAAGAAGNSLAGLVRTVIVQTAEEILERAGHALGPAPLAMDEEHARRVADLTVYIRQHHAERDLAALGTAVLAAGPRW